MFIIIITSFDGPLLQDALTLLKQLNSASKYKKYMVKCHVWKCLISQNQYFFMLVQMPEGAS